MATLAAALAVLVPSNGASAASGHRITALQFNAAEGTDLCANPAGMHCLAAASGNRGRDMYAVEEVCRPEVARFRRNHPGWSVVYGQQTVRLKDRKKAQCKYKGNMLASPHRITNTKTYKLSASFTKDGIKHDFVLVCGLVHANVRFYGCATHLVFGRSDRQRIQVNNLVKDTAGYRRQGRVVVAGDFNIAESSQGAGKTPRLRPITRAHFVETDKDRTPTHKNRKFDYIFYFSKAGVTHRAALTGPVATSDHRVLLGEARV